WNTLQKSLLPFVEAKIIPKFAFQLIGRVAEWLGRGLQNLVQRFESARDLYKKHLLTEVLFSFLALLSRNNKIKGSTASLISRKRFNDYKKNASNAGVLIRIRLGKNYFLPSIFSFNSASASMSPKVDFSACAGISAASSFFFAGAAAFLGAFASSLNIAV
ncbi:MAG: hypothetical protein RJA23_1244, partial [Bacteroidota bacterium]